MLIPHGPGDMDRKKAKRIEEENIKAILFTFHFKIMRMDQGTWTGIKAKKIVERNTKGIFCTSNVIVMLMPNGPGDMDRYKSKKNQREKQKGHLFYFLFHNHAET
jgi:hypothetical protein